MLVVVLSPFALMYLLGRAATLELANPPPAGPDLPGVTGILEGFSRPISIAVSPAGDRIWVVDAGEDGGVLVLDALGEELGRLAPPDGAADPAHVVVDPASGEVLVADAGAGRIDVYDAEGQWLRSIGPPPGIGEWRPGALAVDLAGLLVVADLAADPVVVRVVDAGGGTTPDLGGGASLGAPSGIAIDVLGTVYVADGPGGRVLAYGPSGELLATADDGFPDPLGEAGGIVVDTAMQLLVVDVRGRRILVHGTGATGPELALLGTIDGAEAGGFAEPRAIAIDGNGRVYVTDTATGSIYLLGP